MQITDKQYFEWCQMNCPSLLRLGEFFCQHFEGKIDAPPPELFYETDPKKAHAIIAENFVDWQPLPIVPPYYS